LGAQVLKSSADGLYSANKSVVHAESKYLLFWKSEIIFIFIKILTEIRNILTLKASDPM